MRAAIRSIRSSRQPNLILSRGAKASPGFWLRSWTSLRSVCRRAQGLVFTETFYWDMNDSARAWTQRWQAERPGKFPTMIQAGVYSSIIHYLKAVEALGADGDGKAVAAKMKEMPTDDRLFGKGVVRSDGRKTHDAYLFEVKKPAESQYPGDFYKTRATIPAAEAFRPLKDGGCPLVNG